MASLSNHFLLQSFTDFYQEFVLAKKALRKGRLAEYLQLSAAGETPSLELMIAVLFKQLRTRLGEQQGEIRRNASIMEQKDYLRVLYVICVLTDEQMLFDMGPEVAELWRKELLETAFFGTAEAGSRFYQRVDELLGKRGDPERSSDLAAVYLVSLSLGFRGRYRSPSAAAELKRIQLKLYRQLEKPVQSDSLFYQAYQHHLTEVEDPSRHRVAPLSKWRACGYIAVAAYLLISSIIWFSNQSRLENMVAAFDCGARCDSKQSSDQVGSTGSQP